MLGSEDCFLENLNLKIWSLETHSYFGCNSFLDFMKLDIDISGFRLLEIFFDEYKCARDMKNFQFRDKKCQLDFGKSQEFAKEISLDTYANFTAYHHRLEFFK